MKGDTVSSNVITLCLIIKGALPLGVSGLGSGCYNKTHQSLHECETSGPHLTSVPAKGHLQTPLYQGSGL